MVRTLNVLKLAREIIAGRRLKRGDIELLGLANAKLEELKTGADRIREEFLGRHVDICGVIMGRVGSCDQNCKFCVQSKYNHSDFKFFDFLDEEEILIKAKRLEEQEVNRVALIDSGHYPKPENFEKILSAFRKIREHCKVALCADLGRLSQEQFHQLRLAGVTSVHCDIETSCRFYPHICTTNQYDDRLDNIMRAKKEGLRICSGGIIGMGENWEDRIDMALTLAELEVDSIPINCLIPMEGTPLENQEALSEDDVLRTVAIFRYLNPEAHIRLGEGRLAMDDKGKESFVSGASASTNGNKLMVSDVTIKDEIKMLTKLGRDVTPRWK